MKLGANDRDEPATRPKNQLIKKLLQGEIEHVPNIKIKEINISYGEKV
jgi:hypothetical protein